MSEAPKPTAPDEDQTTDDTVNITATDIPDRYVDRLEKAKNSRISGLVTAMGILEDEQGLRIPIRGTKARLEDIGLTPQFDLVPVKGVVAPETYLGMVSEGNAPVGSDEPATTLHDFLFHGVGFEGMDEPLGSIVKSASGRALLTKNPIVMSNCVDTIDALSGSYFSSETAESPVALEQDIEGRIIGLAEILGTPIDGDSMLTGSQAQRDSQTLKANAASVAQVSVDHFYKTLQQFGP